MDIHREFGSTCVCVWVCGCACDGMRHLSEIKDVHTFGHFIILLIYYQYDMLIWEQFVCILVSLVNISYDVCVFVCISFINHNQ